MLKTTCCYHLPIKLINMTYINITKDILSILSNKPPCPGIKFEKSFISFSRLILLKNKSPICPTIDKIIVTTTNLKLNDSTKFE